jgi:methyl-accepting chemotaxis protein
MAVMQLLQNACAWMMEMGSVMAYVRNLRVGTTLTAMLVVFVLVFAAAGLGGLRLLQSASEWIDELGHANAIRAHALSDATIALLRAQTLITDARIQMESGMEAERDALLANAREQMTRAASRFEDFALSLRQDNLGAEAIIVSYQAWVDNGLEPWWHAVQGWNGLVAQQLERERIAPDGQVFLQAVAGYQEAARAAGAATAKSAAASLSLARMASLGLLGLVAGLAFACRAFIGRMVLRPLADVGRHLRAIAAGQLDGRIARGSRNEIGELQRSLRDMQEDLQDRVRAIRASAAAIDGRLAAMLQENEDLSRRTLEQAASLEQTAASVEQLAQSVRDNAQHAAMASARTETAAGTARRAGEATGHVVRAMETLSRHTREIADIVKVIDDVAFQTTLLSHNAAIEAAHAGEYGKGFAVVATAVRQLAQRSTDAASQVRRLSEAARSSGTTGMKEVDRAGSIMQEVVAVVGQATQLAHELAGSASQQSQAIAQINVTVSQLDGMTQRNAALVDSASQAALALSEQSDALRRAVAVFRLAADTDAAWAPPSGTGGPGADVPATAAWVGQKLVHSPM